MLKKIAVCLLAVLMCIALLAQNKGAALNSKADAIVGEYSAIQSGHKSKVKISKSSDGTYTAQVFWVEKDKNEDGSKRLDVKNPDKSLRSVPCDKVVLFKGLSYDASAKIWNGTKIYDPTRGIRANVKVRFADDGRLCIKGTVLGIGETVYWTRL